MFLFVVIFVCCFFLRKMQLFISHVPIRKRLAEIIAFQRRAYVYVAVTKLEFLQGFLSAQSFLHRELKLPDTDVLHYTCP